MQCYLVGGAVRDELLGYPHSERDWVVVGATPEQMRRAGFKQVGKDFPVFLHPETGEEYALARTERKSGHGYGGFEFNTDPSVTLEEDLARRDLTINAMARAGDGGLIDPYGGRRDLEQRLLRHVSPAFTEDPLRVLRVARFAARYAHLGFRIAEETLQLMRDISESGELEYLVPERVWRETERAMGERDPQVFFLTLHECGALPVVFPEMASLLACDAPRELQRIASAETDPRIRLALFLRRLEPAAVESLAQRLILPKPYAELSLLLARHGSSCGRELNAERALALLEATDAFRRNARFEMFLRACRQLDPAWSALLEKAWQRARQVNTDALRAQGFEGKALGAAIQRQRRHIIEESLHER